MAWRKVDEADLAAVLSQGEIDAFRQDGSTDGSDAVARLIASTAGFVRSHIATSGKVRLAPDPVWLPEGLVVPAMEIAAYTVLKRIDVVPNEARKTAYQDAKSMLKDIAAGNLAVESYGAEESAATGGPAIEVVTEVRPRVTAAKLEGL